MTQFSAVVEAREAGKPDQWQ